MTGPAASDGPLPGTPGTPGALGTARPAPRSLRELWAIEQNPRLVALAQTTAGKVALCAAFGGVGWMANVSLAYMVAAAAFAYLPAYRSAIMIAAAAVALARSREAWLQGLQPVLVQEGAHAAIAWPLVVGALLAYFACALAALVVVRRQPGSWLARRPVLAQLLVAFLLAGLASAPQLQGEWRVGAWALLSVFTAYMWFFAYAVQDQRSRTPGPLPFQMGIFHPLWRSSVGSFSPTPFGKGAAFLRKHQARTAEELAVTQLKALKLLAWALLLIGLNKLLIELLEVRLGIPKTASVYAAFMQGQQLPLSVRWSSLVWATLAGTLALAIWGHKIIAVARLAGFRLPRNTWRPLESRTLAEFWNRYYYYFKELLVEFFFYPTFFSVLRKHPRLRVFFATFMAAGVGNALYHFIRDIHLVASLGWQAALASYTSYLVYCAALATGIGISQARISAGRRPSMTWAGTLRSVLCVWGFIVCLQVFADENRAFPLAERIAFFTSLFGIS